MKFKIHIFAILSLMVFSTEAFAKINVVSTIPDFGAIAKEVGGDVVSVKNLVNPNQDPHFVDAKPSHVITLNKADLLLVTGMELEAGWLPPLVKGARNRDILKGSDGYLDCSRFIAPLDIKAVDRSKGDIHPGGNPHYWIDPRNGLRLADGIAKRLIQLEPKYKSQITKQLNQFKSNLKYKIKEWEKKLQKRKGMNIIVFHESWTYFLHWAGFKQAGTLEPKPGIPPKPAHVAKLIKHIRGKNVKYIIQESFYPTNLSKLVAQKSGAKLKVLPTMVGAKYTKSYIHVIDTIVKELTK